MKKVENIFAESRKSLTFAPSKQTVRLAQLVRASDCGSEGRGFDPHTSPLKRSFLAPLFIYPPCFGQRLQQLYLNIILIY